MPDILLIEDDPDTGESIVAMLELSGHRVRWAKNGVEALELLTERPEAALVLTDILMPEMDGLESIQRLRELRPNLPFIAMTAKRDSPYLKAASLFGAKATLGKPFSVRELQAAITQALSGKEFTLSRPPKP